MKLETFVEETKKNFGSNLLSIILYGSAAGEDFQKKYSDINLLIVLKDASLSEIARAKKTYRSWMQKGNPPPLFMDPEDIEKSHDVFPIEFLDIQEKHRVLHGNDPFDRLKIETNHLRLECEEELKGKILHLREHFLKLYPSKRKIKNLLLASSSSLFAILRGCLRVLGETVPPTKREMVQKLNAKTHFDLSIFEKILDVREEKTKLARAEIFSWAEEYLTTLKKLARLIDTL